MNRFIIQYDVLPVSVNNYIRPSARVDDEGEAKIHMYETQASKDFKKRFKAYLKREVAKQKWDLEQTKDGHWYLDCIFYQARTNQDNNNYYKILCDSLTGIVVADDKNILVRTQRVMYDTKRPRFVAVLKPVEYIGIFKNEEQYTEFLEDNCFNCKKNHEKCPLLRKAKEGRSQQELNMKNSKIICTNRKT